MKDDKFLLRLPETVTGSYGRGGMIPAWAEFEAPVMVEIARSFSYKLNVGNYESRDFFCSQKAECRTEDAERTSDALYEFCKSQVLKAVKEYTAMRQAQQDKKGVHAA